MRSSQRLREAIHSTVAQTDNDLEAQRQATEFALRKRIHEMKRAKEEDEWQKKNVSSLSKSLSVLFQYPICTLRKHVHFNSLEPEAC